MAKQPSFGEAINELHHLVNLYHLLWDGGYLDKGGDINSKLSLEDLPDEISNLSFDDIAQVREMICKDNLGTQCRKMLNSMKQ